MSICSEVGIRRGEVGSNARHSDFRPPTSALWSFPVSDGPDFSKAELIPVIAQDIATGDVLMLAYMNQAAYQETLQTGRVCYWSRSRQKLWRKGEESGHVQE